MRPIKLLLILWSVLMALILLAGCGSNGSASEAGHPNSPATRSPSPAGTGSITVRVDKSFYLAGDMISVTVSNQSPHTISFPDHLTNCSVILLQRQKAQPETSDQVFMDANPCKLKTATRMYSLVAGQTLTVRLVAPKNGWLTGWFLATLSYRSSATGNSPTTISSPAFTIGPLGL